MILSHIMSLFLCSLFFLSINLIGCFKMLVNGDMGSVEIFLKGPMELTPFTIDTCPITQNLNKGFINYRRLMCASKQYLDQADLYVILGDSVYTETNSKENKPSKPVTNSVNQNRMINWSKQLDKQDIYNGRLICAWEGLKKIYFDYNDICNVEENPQIFKSTLDSNFPNIDIIFGNHSYDVDIEIETELMRKLSNNFALPVDDKLVLNYNITLEYPTYDDFYYSHAKFLTKEELLLGPKITQHNKNGIKIQFLDFDSMVLQCSYSRTEEQYNNCLKINNIDRYTAFHSFVQSKIYMIRTMAAFKYMDKDADWRIIRLHEPIFNLEGNDCYHLWHDDFIHLGKNYGTLFGAIKKGKFHFILASHTHLANIFAFPYRSGLDYLKKNFIFKETNYVETGCFDKFNYYINNKEKDVNYKTCKFNQHNNTWSINRNNPEYLWQFNMGNSGKKFDKLYEDQRTRGVLIWGRANYVNSYEAFGGFFFNFTKEYVNINYIELHSFKNPVLRDNLTEDNSQFFINNSYNFKIVKNDEINIYPNIDNQVLNKISEVDNLILKIIFGVSVISLLLFFVVVYTIHYPKIDLDLSELAEFEYISFNN